MAADNSISPGGTESFDDVGSVPSFPEIGVYYARHDRDLATGEVNVWVFYYGWPEELVAAGIATVEMLGPKIKGRKRIDADGDPFTISRYWRLRDGQPQSYCKLQRLKTAKLLHTLPGALKAVTAYLRKNAARDERTGGTAECREWRSQIEQEVEASLRELSRAIMPPVLRQLIDAVDNTP